MSEVTLVLYNNDDKNVLVMASSRVDSLNNLLNWLERSNILYVPVLPEQQGVFCVDEKIAYRVYQVIYDKENNVYNNSLIYSLQWVESAK